MTAHVPRAHEFFQFMAETRRQMAEEYERIRSRAQEDPGTAGDRAEEAWAAFLQRWLPPAYRVVTKGRLLDEDGTTSPQLDVLVLHPSYPLALLKQKLYFRGGVVAAFECKLTLKTEHLREFFKRAALIKRRREDRDGSLFEELNEPPILGLLAHGHSWRSLKTKSFVERVDDVGPEFARHPRELPELLTVPGLGTLALGKSIAVGPRNIFPEDPYDVANDIFSVLPKGGVVTTYWSHTDHEERPEQSSLGELVTNLTERLAMQDPAVRPTATYLGRLGPRTGLGKPIFWEASVLSRNLRNRLRRGAYEEDRWSHWSREQF